MLTTLINRMKALRGETFRYLVAGILTTLINFTLFTIMTKLCKIDVTLSNVTSISVSIVFAFFVNKLYVFERRSVRGLWAEFIKFVGSRLFTMALEVGAVLLFVEILKGGELFGKLASQVLVVIANYVISKAVVFRGKNSGS